MLSVYNAIKVKKSPYIATQINFSKFGMFKSQKSWQVRRSSLSFKSRAQTDVKVVQGPQESRSLTYPRLCVRVGVWVLSQECKNGGFQKKNYFLSVNPLSANPTKWQQPANCFSVFGCFVELVLKLGLAFNYLEGINFHRGQFSRD